MGQSFFTISLPLRVFRFSFPKRSKAGTSLLFLRKCGRCIIAKPSATSVPLRKPPPVRPSPGMPAPQALDGRTHQRPIPLSFGKSFPRCSGDNLTHGVYLVFLFGHLHLFHIGSHPLPTCFFFGLDVTKGDFGPFPRMTRACSKF